ncbi:MAG: hypothetical protein WDW36_006860 [Sanguina aurantia]
MICAPTLALSSVSPPPCIDLFRCTCASLVTLLPPNSKEPQHALKQNQPAPAAARPPTASSISQAVSASAEEAVPGAPAQAAADLRQHTDHHSAGVSDAQRLTHSDGRTRQGSGRSSAHSAASVSSCLGAAVALKELCWDKLHSGHWADVSMEWRDAFAAATLLLLISESVPQSHGAATQHRQQAPHPAQPRSTPSDTAPRSHDQQQQQQQQQQLQQQQQQQQQPTPAPVLSVHHLQRLTGWYRSVMQRLDLAVMMGSPRFRHVLDAAIAAVESQLTPLRRQAPDMSAASWRRDPDVPPLPHSASQAAPGARSMPAPEPPPAQGDTEQLGGPAGAAARGHKRPPCSADVRSPGQRPKAGLSSGHAPPPAAPCDRDSAQQLQLGMGEEVSELPNRTARPPLTTDPAPPHPDAAAASPDSQAPHDRQLRHTTHTRVASSLSDGSSFCLAGTSMGHRKQRPAPAGPGRASTSGGAGAVPLPSGSLMTRQGCSRVPCKHMPALEDFLMEHMVAAAPVVLTGTMQLWPALQRWPDLSYLKAVAGERTVPVEVGAHYLADGWGQQLMNMAQFLDQHVAGAPASVQPSAAAAAAAAPPAASARGGAVQHDPAAASAPPDPASRGAGHDCRAAAAAASPGTAAATRDPDAEMLPGGPAAARSFAAPTAAAAAAAAAAQETQAGDVPAGAAGASATAVHAAAAAPIRYLAQHPLFDQIPALRSDILTPEYCCLGEGQMQATNAWLGPPGTVTPLHHDPHHNLLAQVVGHKYIRLYAPSCSAQLHPYGSGLTTNSSQIDLDAPVSGQLYPGFADLCHLDVMLSPGQMLYIPPGWWHYVKACSISFSVSFWWK